MRGVNGAADLSVRASTPLGFDEALYPRVAMAAGVMVTHSDASAAIADRVLTLTADGLVERRGR